MGRLFMSSTKKGLPFLVATTASTIAGVALLGLPTALASTGSMSLVGLTLAMFAVASIAACFSRVGTLVSQKNKGAGYLQLISVSFPRWVGILGELLSIAAILTSTSYLCSFVTVPAFISVAELVYPQAVQLSPVVVAVAIYLLSAVLLHLPRITHNIVTKGQYLVLAFKLLLGVLAVAASVHSFQWSNIATNFNNTWLDNTTLLMKLIQLSVFGLTGFELVLNLTNVAKRPARDIPRAILLGTFAGSFIYFCITAMVLGTVNVAYVPLASKNTLAVFMEVLQLPAWVTILGSIGALLVSSMGVYTWLYALNNNVDRVLQNMLPGTRKKVSYSKMITITSMLALCWFNLPTMTVLAWATKFMAATYLLVCLSYLVYCLKMKKLLSATLPFLACTFATIMLVI
jgi:APA family basic amino acid/polyamine antiporter